MNALAGRGGQEHSDSMLVALVCLWIGFALGFLCAAILHASGRSAREDRESLGAMRVARSPR